jgi:hypothetical protein
VTPPLKVLAQLEAIVVQSPGVRVEVLTQNGTVDMRYVDGLLAGGVGGDWEYTTACFNTDIAYLHFTGLPSLLPACTRLQTALLYVTPLGSRTGKAFLYGHGDICDAHAPGEFIMVDDLLTCPDRYVRLAQTLLQHPPGTLILFSLKSEIASDSSFIFIPQAPVEPTWSDEVPPSDEVRPN